MQSFKQFSESLFFHLENKIPLSENVFRYGSKSYFDLINEMRENMDSLVLSDVDKEILRSDIGTFGIYEDQEVPLDLPFIAEDTEVTEKWSQKYKDSIDCNNPKGFSQRAHCDGKKKDIKEAEYNGQDVELDKPKRGGAKKFYVYVKNDKGNVIKVQFGDTSGLNAKISNPEARKSFVARHQCELKKDKTKPGYWACRLPWFAKSLGLSGGGRFFW